VVVINPYKELGLQHFRVPSDIRSLLFGSEIANLYLQPHCGGDLALLKAAAVYLWREEKSDLDYLKNHCTGVDAFLKDLDSEDLQSLLEKCGITFDDLKMFCHYLAESRNTIFAWCMGITHQQHGVNNVEMIANLALLRGMVGKPGAGLLPIRGHSNVQGVGTVGVIPKLQPQMAAALLNKLQIQVPDAPGKDTFGCMESAFAGEIDFALLLGGNLYAANPDLNRAAEALARVGFTAFVSTSLNLGHIHGHGQNTLILPVRARDEEKQSTSQESMFNYIRLSAGGLFAPADDLPAESELFAYVGQRLFGEKPLPWSKLQDHDEIRQFISETVPGMQPMADLAKEKEFTIPGRIKHRPDFNTENGRANLAVIEAPDARPQKGYLNLMTMRSEGQFNTIIYEDEDLYRGVEHRQVIFMNRIDILANELNEGDWIWIKSEIGKMKVQLVQAPIRAGNVAMYYPEANAIVPGKTDPHSRTPVFKRVRVKVLQRMS
jgi:molybdopterin-dependent oxidoreductase alpha subunit